MPRLFIGNFDFERQLTTGGRLPVNLARLHAEMACIWVSTVDDGDLIHCEEPVPEEFLEDLANRGCGWPRFLDVVRDIPSNVTEVVTWGWSGQMVDLARQLSPRQTLPAVDVVELVNSRSFSAPLEQEFQVAIPGARTVHSLEELAVALREGPTRLGEPVPWMLKANLGQAGRERFIGAGSDLGVRVERWILPRLKRDGAVYLEPIVVPIEEVGIQWMVPRKGSPRLEAVVPLISARGGGYQGSTVVNGIGKQWEPALAIQVQAVERLQRLGYFGPVGIDAMRYRDAEGTERIRPLQDINARWTMGRIALHWRDRLSPKGTGTWTHAPIIPDFAAIATSPVTVGSQLVKHRTWWIPGE